MKKKYNKYRVFYTLLKEADAYFRNFDKDDMENEHHALFVHPQLRHLVRNGQGFTIDQLSTYLNLKR